MTDAPHTVPATAPPGAPAGPPKSAAHGDTVTASGDYRRWTYGLIAVIAGLVVILISLVIVVGQFKTAADVGSVMGVIVTPIGTMVGAYFGVAAGSDGKAKADANAAKAHATALHAATLISDPEQQQAFIKTLT